MALCSMTGYGRGHAASGGARVDAAFASVNRKQLDISVTVPRDYAELERLVVQRIQRRVARGRVTGTLHVTCRNETLRGAIHIDKALAGAYVTALRQSGAQLELRDRLDTSLLLQLPDVIRFEVSPRVLAAVRQAAVRATDRALADLVRMRRDEGRVLEQALREHLNRLEALLHTINRRAPRVAEHYRRNLMQRLRTAGLPLDEADERLLREVALFADRSDISEECTRLRSHVRQARRLLRSAGGPAGRTLDFLAQEMMREINTTGAKSNDIALGNEVIAFKTELERFREQVQNIE